MKEILSYLTALEQHNERDWYHSHKEERLQAVQAFEALVADLSLDIHAFDPGIPLAEPKSLTFQLVRDTRFSHDKSPYRPVFRAHIGPQGKLPIPVGYYLYLQPGNRSFLGGGLFTDLFPDATRRVWEYICQHGEAWEMVISDPALALPVKGSALQKPPKGFPPDHPQIASLKQKSWYVEQPIEDKALLQEDFCEVAIGIFSRMMALNHMLNQALEGFQMPAR